MQQSIVKIGLLFVLFFLFSVWHSIFRSDEMPHFRADADRTLKGILGDFSKLSICRKRKQRTSKALRYRPNNCVSRCLSGWCPGRDSNPHGLAAKGF